MKVKSSNFTLIIFLVMLLGGVSNNTVHAQSLLKKVKKEVKAKSKKNSKSTSSNTSSSNTSSNSKTTSSNSTSASANSSSNKSSNNSAKKSTATYSGRGQVQYKTIMRRLGLLESCKENPGSDNCGLADRSNYLRVISDNLPKFAERDPDYDLTEFRAAYDKHKQLFDKDSEVFFAESIPFEMKEYNTSSPIYDKVKFFDFSLSGSNLEKMEFYVAMTRSADGFEWKKKVNYQEGYDTSGLYQAKTFFNYAPTGQKVGDENDKQIFYITAPKEGKSYGVLQMDYDYFNKGGNTGGIILFGEQSPEELMAEVQKMKILSTNEEAERSALEKKHVGKIVFASQKVETTLSETSLKSTFTLGNPIFARVILKDPTNSMRELFIKEGLTPGYQDSWMVCEYYKNGELIGVYDNSGKGFTGYRQGSSTRDMYELKNKFDKDRSFDEALLEDDFYIYNSAAPLWRGLLEKGVSNGTHKIDMKYYVLHNPAEGHDVTEENKGRLYKKLISEGSFKLIVNEAGKAKFCTKAKMCKK